MPSVKRLNFNSILTRLYFGCKNTTKPDFELCKDQAGIPASCICTHYGSHPPGIKHL